jgi:hypothetical protein
MSRVFVPVFESGGEFVASGPGAFPQATLRDSFTDTNGTALTSHTPDAGGSWSTLSGLSTMEVQSNTCISSTGVATNFYSSDDGPDLDVYFTLSNKPDDGQSVGVWARMVDRGSSSTVDGYLFVASAVAGASNDLVRVYRVTDGAAVAIVCDATAEVTVGEKFGLRVQGSSFQMYRDTGGGWSTLGSSGSDSTYGSAGRTGPYGSNASGRIDDLYVGTL